MINKIPLKNSDIDRIIEMAWEDRTTFDSIEYQFGLKEQDVKQLMKENYRKIHFQNNKLLQKCLLQFMSLILDTRT